MSFLNLDHADVTILMGEDAEYVEETVEKT